ncbi:MAG: transcriptional regulator [Candidatus Brocadia sp. WS118]|nr:MAG: transcriptional regulator [Candidatus Brocadia sp. WS118]
MQNPNIMTIKQVAEYLKVSPRTIYKLVKTGGIPTFRIMNMWRFEQSKIDQWIQEKSETNNFNGTGGKEHAKSIDHR